MRRVGVLPDGSVEAYASDRAVAPFENVRLSIDIAYCQGSRFEQLATSL